jgi:channel protein (hemolysin III family)
MLIAPYNGITMNTLTLGSDYNPREEFLNALTHALGVVFAVVVLVLMLIKASQSSIDFSALQITGLVVYGLGMIAMFLSSSIYHAFSHTRAKWVLKRIDHSAIFAMIAGTYTPILLIGNLCTTPQIIAEQRTISNYPISFFIIRNKKAVCCLIYP